MSPEPKKRPRRVPYTPEEVANIIAFKQRRERFNLLRFKKTAAYKYQNLFNIACFFIYWEIVFCFFGPAAFQKHYSVKVEPKYGDVYDLSGKPILSELEFTCVDGEIFTFIINDFEPVPTRFSIFTIGSDYLLGKNLKGIYTVSNTKFRLFAASPVLLLIMLMLVSSTVAYLYNLNENSYSLMALTVINSLCLLGLLTL